MSLNALQDTREAAPSAVTVSPLAIHIGAEIGGVDITRPLPPEQVRDIRAALLKWKVIFFYPKALTRGSRPVLQLWKSLCTFG